MILFTRILNQTPSVFYQTCKPLTLIILFQVKIDPVTFVVSDIITAWVPFLVDEPHVDHHTLQEYTFQGLHEDTYYELELSARNNIGWSPPAKKVIHTKSTKGVYLNYVFVFLLYVSIFKQ